MGHGYKVNQDSLKYAIDAGGHPGPECFDRIETDRQYDGWQKKKQAGTCFFLGKIKSDILQRTQLVETVTLVLQFS